MLLPLVLLEPLNPLIEPQVVSKGYTYACSHYLKHYFPVWEVHTEWAVFLVY